MSHARLDVLAKQNAALLATIAASGQAHASINVSQPQHVVIVPQPHAPAPSTISQQMLERHLRTLRALLRKVAHETSDRMAAGAERVTGCA